LRDSIPEGGTGIVRFHITLADEPGADARALADVVEMWVRAINLGFFGDARISVSEPIEARGRSVVGGMRCERVPSAAFQLLARMVSRFSRVRARVESIDIWREEGHRSLVSRDPVEVPPLPETFPFPVDYPNDFHADVRVEVGFRSPLTPPEKDTIFDALSVWDALVEALADEERWAEVSDYETRLMSRSIVEHVVSGYFAGPEGFDLVVHMGLRLHQRLNIERLTME
jgi:hypothetical protein